MSNEYELVVSELSIKNTDKESMIDSIRVHIDTQGEEEFVLLTCGQNAIPISAEQWPFVNQAIDTMIKDIVKREEEQVNNENV